MAYYTFKKVALAHKAAWQKLRFLAGKGYYLIGRRPTPVPPTARFTMYDSVTISQIPSNAYAVAGYVNGHYATWPSLQASFPHAKKLSIDVFGSTSAECLDVENGDATNDQAPEWIKRQMARGVKRPVVYTSVSNASKLLGVLAAHGIYRSAVRLWTAHYTNTPHICGPACWPGLTTKADATQYTSDALGRNLDASLCEPSFL